MSLHDFIIDAYTSGCNNFKVTTHITPDGNVKIHFEGKGVYQPEADGIVKNDSVTLFENVRIC